MALAKTTSALLLCCIALFAMPASARPLRHHAEAGHHYHHHHARYAARSDRAARHSHQARRHRGDSHYARLRRHRGGFGAYAMGQRELPAQRQAYDGFAMERPALRGQRGGFSRASSFGGGGFGGGGVVSEARRWIGTNPTGRASLWCARFMNFVLTRTGHHGSGSDMARSFSSYGTRVSGPQVGAIAVMSRGRRGGHVGVVSGLDARGNPIIISGNHGHRVAESVYPRGRIYAYVMP
jgi:uncharacterized protein (TIGR02594 family)